MNVRKESQDLRLKTTHDQSKMERISAMAESQKRILVIGASRGIGAAVAKHFAQKGHFLLTVSRNQSVVGEWIEADISNSDGIKTVVNRIADSPLDALLFMGGVWEAGAFTEQYDFYKSPDQETRYVLAVNTIAPIELMKQLAQNLAQSQNPRAIFMGALSGLDNCPTTEVANTASKFGLRGAVQSLRLALHNYHIGMTVINPGNVATEEVMEDIKAGRFEHQTPIPLEDLISAIEWVLSLSNIVDIQEINMSQKC